MTPRPAIPLLLLTILVLACNGGQSMSQDAVSVALEDDTPTPAAGASPVASPVAGIALTPRPSAAVSDIATARQLEADGDTQGAADAYIAVAASTPASRSEATLGAARMLLELERPADVRILLEPFAANATGRDAAAHYLLARAYAALSMWAPSLEQYDLYVQSGRPALPYAYLDRARDLLELGSPVAAATSTQNGLNLGVPNSSKRAFQTSIAQSNERAGNLTEAIRGYTAIGDDAFALSRIVATKRTQGDTSYVADQNKLMGLFPGSSQALTAMTEALGRGEVISPLLRGTIYYRQNEYTKAEPALREQIALSPDAPASAEAYYYLAAVLESKGDLATAQTNYQRVTSLNPTSSVADDALWWRGRLLEDDGKLDDAKAVYARIVNEYPASSWAPDAGFRRGLLSYRANKYAEAASLWAEGGLAASSADNKQRFALWQGKALLKANNRDAAKPILDQLAAANEDDYYGIRAYSLLRGKTSLPKATRESKVDLTPTFDWSAAESWLAGKTGRAVVASGWSNDNRWLRAQELWLVGRTSQGDNEAFDLLEAYARDPIAMYTMARTLQAQGRIGLSGRAGQRLLRVLNTNPNEGLPKALLSLSYPPAFGPTAQRYATNEKVSPLLLLAFVRQESFFDPRAESGVGAVGLTQVLPSTAKTIADRLGVGFTPDQLMQADLNLRLGTIYMGQQLRSFDDEIFVAFAAYNAGPEAAKRWRKASGDDADLFLETVEFSESRLYVELVAENYAMYRYLYANETAPNLPD